ncbi:MAG: rane-binding protein [Crocinitomicaceae bacterium]|jgi:antitoxin component YwqK of YwqJK toxin-antitoxin module|nr:rane-binding protein [Crocinitomicaceae bacterium]
MAKEGYVFEIQNNNIIIFKKKKISFVPLGFLILIGFIILTSSFLIGLIWILITLVGFVANIISSLFHQRLIIEGQNQIIHVEYFFIKKLLHTKHWNMNNYEFYINNYRGKNWMKYGLFAREKDSKYGQNVFEIGKFDKAKVFIDQTSKWIKMTIPENFKSLIVLFMVFICLTNLEIYGQNQGDTLKVKYQYEMTIISDSKQIRVVKTKYDTKPEQSLREEFYENGNRRSITRFIGRSKNGEELSYWENGQLKEQSFWKKGKAIGERLIYHSNGELKEKFSHVRGLASGPYESYYPNGKLCYQGEMKKGGRHGEWLVYNESGKLIRKDRYRKGIIQDSEEIK